MLSGERFDATVNQTDRVFHCFDPLDCRRSFWNRCIRHCSRRPETPEELYPYSHLVLGHFTSATFLSSIWTRGLEPDSDQQQAMDATVTSQKNSVYLRARYDRLSVSRVANQHGGTCIAVVVRVPISCLAADESALTLDQRERCAPDMQLFLSLRFGTCKHPGVIPPSCIVGVYDIEGKKLLYGKGKKLFYGVEGYGLVDKRLTELTARMGPTSVDVSPTFGVAAATGALTARHTA